MVIARIAFIFFLTCIHGVQITTQRQENIPRSSENTDDPQSDQIKELLQEIGVEDMDLFENMCKTPDDQAEEWACDEMRELVIRRKLLQQIGLPLDASFDEIEAVCTAQETLKDAAKIKACEELDGIICSVCLASYKRKKIFCGHKFCEDCITELQKRNAEFTCPLCRRIDASGYQLEAVVFGRIVLANGKNRFYPSKDFLDKMGFDGVIQDADFQHVESPPSWKTMFFKSKSHVIYLNASTATPCLKKYYCVKNLFPVPQIVYNWDLQSGVHKITVLKAFAFNWSPQNTDAVYETLLGHVFTTHSIQSSEIVQLETKITNRDAEAVCRGFVGFVSKISGVTWEVNVYKIVEMGKLAFERINSLQGKKVSKYEKAIKYFPTSNIHSEVCKIPHGGKISILIRAGQQGSTTRD